MDNHPDYSGKVDTSPVHEILLKIENEGPLLEYTNALNEPTIQMFNSAAVINREEPELLTVIGLLHLINQDYQSSIASFTEAIKLQPNNPELWNRLGAVIANSGRALEAPQFYKQALSLRPNYIRAKVNCSQAYINTQMYHRAYPILLDVILNAPDALHSSTPHPHLWPQLRQCFDFCGMPELSDAAMMRDIDVLKTAMENQGMNPDGTVREGFKQPIGADFE
jgi:peroxin-5